MVIGEFGVYVAIILNVMAKWNCWFGWCKRLLTSESKPKNSKKLRWSHGRVKLKQCPTITEADKTLNEAREEQRKHALTVAIATAAAAEAAVAAAHAAAEVVRLTGASRSYSYLSKGDRNLAATKIQSAYRAHLARKALKALKGIVRLQAIVRGRAVRRQMLKTTQNLPSNSNKQVGIQKISDSPNGINKDDKNKQLQKQKKKLEETEIETDSQSQRTWDCSLLSKEDSETIRLKKQEAIFKRERMKQYSFSHRERKISHMMEDSMQNKEFGGESCRTLGQWLDKEKSNGNVFHKIAMREWCDHDSSSHVVTQKKNVKIEEHLQEDDEVTSQISFPRKSCSRVKKSLVGDDNCSMPNSPVFPTYMAVTESVKAKARSASTPKQRTGFLDVCYDQSDSQRESIFFSYSCYGASTSSNGKK